MNDQLRDDEFDRRLREATRRLAGGPASAGLRARVAAIPREQPGPASGRRRFGLGVRFAGAAAALIVLAVVAAILLASTLPRSNAVVPGASSNSSSPSHVPTASTMPSFPVTGRLVGRTPLPSTPLGPLWITIADGAPWIALGGDPQGTVERIDPASGKVTETVKVGFAPSDLAAYGTSLWVTNGTGAMTHPPGPYVNTVQRIDTTTGHILATVPLELPGQVVADASGAWVITAQHSLVHVSSTGQVLGTVVLASGSPRQDLPVSLAIAGGRIWIVLAHGGASGITLEAIDPANLKTVLMTDVTQEIGWLVPTQSALYGAQVTGTTTFAWTRIDLQTGRVTVLGDLPVHPAQFEGLAVTADGAWVLDPGAPPAQAPRVIPFDPMTGRQTGAGVQLTGSFGDFMVASGRDVWALGSEVDHFRF